MCVGLDNCVCIYYVHVLYMCVGLDNCVCIYRGHVLYMCVWLDNCVYIYSVHVCRDMWLNVVKLSASAIGASVVALPYAASLMGIPLFALCTIVLSVLSTISLHWLIDCRSGYGTSYGENVEYFFGRQGKIFFACNMGFLLIGGIVALMMISISNLQIIFGEVYLVEICVYLIVAIVAVYVGTNEFRLGQVSLISLGCVGIFFGLLCTEFFTQYNSDIDIDTQWSVYTCVVSLSVQITMYIASFYVYSLKGPNLKKTITCTFVFVGGLYLFIGTVGVLCFTTINVPSNIMLARWTINPSFVVLVQIGLAFANIAKLPLLLIPLQQLCPIHSLGLLVVCIVVSRLFDDLGQVLQICGVGSGICTAFFIPACMALKQRRRVLPSIVAVASIGLSVAGISTILYTHKGEEHNWEVYEA